MNSSAIPQSTPSSSGFASHSLPSSSRRQPPPPSLSPPPRIGSAPHGGSLPSSPTHAPHGLPYTRSMVTMNAGHRAEIMDDSQSLGLPDQTTSLPRPPRVGHAHHRSESLAPPPPRQRALSETPPRRSDVSRPHALLDAPVVNGLHINSPRDPISGETSPEAYASTHILTSRLQVHGVWTRALYQLVQRRSTARSVRRAIARRWPMRPNSPSRRTTKLSQPT